MALKFLKKKTTKLKSFLREYSVSLYLSPCPFVINMFGIAFETDDYYAFAQEYALAGDLFDIIPPQVPLTGLGFILFYFGLYSLYSVLFSFFFQRLFIGIFVNSLLTLVENYKYLDKFKSCKVVCKISVM